MPLRENQVSAQLASPKTPDKPDQMAKNFHDLIWRSFPMEILGKGELPDARVMRPSTAKVLAAYYQKVDREKK